MEERQETFEREFLDGVLSEEEVKGVSRIHKEFLNSYTKSKDKISEEKWLQLELKKQFPERPSEEIEEMSREIVSSLKTTEAMKVSQQKSIAAGKGRESWLVSTLLQSTSQMSAQKSAEYLQSLDDAIRQANAEMYKTVMTKSSGYSIPNQNPNLDGFIAERHLVNSFNMSAAAKGSDLRAEVPPLKPGETYSKNGFDIVIKDGSGNRIHQYQVKYGATADDTIRMLKSGNYNNQIIVVPEEQVEAVQKAFPGKTVTSTIAVGKIKSEAWTKEQAKEFAQRAQQGNLMDLNWSDYAAKDIAQGMAKQMGHACLLGSVIGAGMTVAKKAWDGEPVDGEEVVEAAVNSGMDFGIKTATAGALKAASEKGILKVIPKGTKGSTFANIAFVAVENIKVFSKVATGQLTPAEGIDAMQQTTGSCLAGMAASAKGASIGASIGTVLGPVGAALGGFVGGTIGYMAGSKVGQAVVKGAQRVRNKAVSVVRSIGSEVRSGLRNVGRTLTSIFA